jgi:hypothetical protein
MTNKPNKPKSFIIVIGTIILSKQITS